jgi:hypothetical protein
MKCYLHIGTEKTATTTIQNFLGINRELLIHNGYFVRNSGGSKYSNDTDLAVAAYDISHRDELCHNATSEEDFIKLQKEIVNQLIRDVSSASKENPRLKFIFSSEHFQSRLVKPGELERLRDLLWCMGMTEVSVIVYLRNPSEIANSLFSTSIRAGSSMIAPPPPTNPYYSNICNHQATLTRFGSIFGEDALIPRIFDKHSFVNGSIICDFISVLGIGSEINDLCKIPGNSNESLSPLGIRILSSLNELIPPYVDGKLNPLRSNIISYIERHFCDQKYSMPSQLYQEYDKEFKASNEWVRDRYFKEMTELFRKTEHPEGDQINITSEDMKKITCLIADIWARENHGNRRDRTVK